jgi:hypothetical protein
MLPLDSRMAVSKISSAIRHAKLLTLLEFLGVWQVVLYERKKVSAHY